MQQNPLIIHLMTEFSFTNYLKNQTNWQIGLKRKFTFKPNTFPPQFSTVTQQVDVEAVSTTSTTFDDDGDNANNDSDNDNGNDNDDDD